jgi:hypothetical protein
LTLAYAFSAAAPTLTDDTWGTETL